MASVFPGALDNIAAGKVDATVTATDHPAHHNALADAVNAVENTILRRTAISVKDYSAVGDGSTDDTTAFANWLTAIAGKEGVVPPGTYIVQPAVLSIPTGTTIIGLGNATIKMKASTASGAGIFYIFTCANAAADIEIRGVTFHGNRSSGNHGLSEDITALHFPSPQRVKVHHCRFTNFRSEGVYVSKFSTTQPTGIEVSDCIFDDVGRKESGDSGNTRQGVAVIAGDDIRIVGNRFYNIGSYGVDLEANVGTETFDGAVIAGNTFSTVVDGAVNVAPTTAANATNVTVTANAVLDATVQGFLVLASGATVTGNVAVEATLRGLLLVDGSTNVSVAGNTLKATGTGAGVADVYLDNATRCNVVGNTLLGTTGAAGIKEAGTSNNNVLQANQISHATRYVLTGASTETDQTLRRTLTIAPPAGGSTLALSGAADGVIDATGATDNLYLKSPAANQMLFMKGAVEDARFNNSGHLVMSGSRQLHSGGMVLPTAVTAASVPNNTIFRDTADDVLKRKDNTGSVAAISSTASAENVNTVAAAGATETLPDVTTATIHHLTLDSTTCALTFPTAAAGKSFTLYLKQDATGGRLATYPGTVRWPAGTAPTLTTTANKTDVLSFVCANGTNWDGFTAGQNY